MIVIVFDTETDALISNSAKRLELQPRILELAAIKFVQTGTGKAVEFQEIGRFDQLFANRRPIPDKVTKITGLTAYDLTGKPQIETQLDAIADFFENSDRVVAHNISYDTEVMDNEFLRYTTRSIRWPEKVCTVEATEHIKGFRLNLSGLHEYLFGEAFEGAHRAMVDVEATMRCYQELVRRDEI